MIISLYLSLSPNQTFLGACNHVTISIAGIATMRVALVYLISIE